AVVGGVSAGGPSWAPPALRNVDRSPGQRPMRNTPLSTIVDRGVITPLLRAAIDVTSLNVEPGAYWPCRARSLSGKWLAGSLRAAKAPVLIPLRKLAGSYVGLDARASTEPARGS